MDNIDFLLEALLTESSGDQKQTIKKRKSVIKRLKELLVKEHKELVPAIKSNLSEIPKYKGYKDIKVVYPDSNRYDNMGNGNFMNYVTSLSNAYQVYYDVMDGKYSSIDEEKEVIKKAISNIFRYDEFFTKGVDKQKAEKQYEADYKLASTTFNNVMKPYKEYLTTLKQYDKSLTDALNNLHINDGHIRPIITIIQKTMVDVGKVMVAYERDIYKVTNEILAEAKKLNN